MFAQAHIVQILSHRVVLYTLAVIVGHGGFEHVVVRVRACRSCFAISMLAEVGASSHAEAYSEKAISLDGRGAGQKAKG